MPIDVSGARLALANAFFADSFTVTRSGVPRGPYLGSLRMVQDAGRTPDELADDQAHARGAYTLACRVDTDIQEGDTVTCANQTYLVAWAPAPATLALSRRIGLALLPLLDVERFTLLCARQRRANAVLAMGGETWTVRDVSGSGMSAPPSVITLGTLTGHVLPVRSDGREPTATTAPGVRVADARYVLTVYDGSAAAGQTIQSTTDATLVFRLVAPLDDPLFVAFALERAR